jgi:hypothetical protein
VSGRLRFDVRERPNKKAPKAVGIAVDLGDSAESVKKRESVAYATVLAPIVIAPWMS